jgi:propanediol utilization protein
MMELSEKYIALVTTQVLQLITEQKGYQYAVPIGISNRHVHLKKQDVEILFGQGYILNKLKDLKQIGEYACQETVSLRTEHQGKTFEIKNVRILGPERNATQVEISATDARQLKLNPPVRNSGNLDKSEVITLIGPKGKVTIKNGCIIATRHLHLSKEDAKRMKLKSGDEISVLLGTEKSGRMDHVSCKVDKNYVLELHIDTDDGNAFRVQSGDMATVLLL